MRHNRRDPQTLIATALIFGSLLTGFGCSGAGLVSLVRTPNEGIQPQIAVDENGTTHLLYYAGDPKAGDLFYSRLDSKGTWTKPLRANSTEGSAIAAGTIRGGQLALGPKGRVHVAWNGSKPLPDSKHKGSPMLYARLNDAGTAFEPERDVMTFTEDLDGGGSVAADSTGNVYVIWHGHAPDARAGEAGRAVYVAKSKDHGATFAKEVAVNPNPTGTCGCCGLEAFADGKGAIYVLYRAATEIVNRDEILMVSRDGGNSFKQLFADPWKIGTCPMSSAALTQTPERIVAAWETAGQVHLAWVEGEKVTRTTPPGVGGKRKHPAIATNTKGDILLVWTEGTGWQRGGAVSWQLFDKSGKPLDERGRQEGVPVWSFAAAYAGADGTFIVLY
jgi:hypothetical protein